MSIEARIAEALLGHSPPNWDYHDACYCGTPTPSPPDYCAHLAAVLVKELGLADLTAALERVEKLAEEWSNSVTISGHVAIVDRGFGAELRDALEGK